MGTAGNQNEGEEEELTHRRCVVHGRSSRNTARGRSVTETRHSALETARRTAYEPPMATSRPWTVYRPGPLTQRDEGLWTVDDDIPGIPGANRRMMVVKRLDGSLLFYNAVPVDDATLTQLRALGKPSQLIVPNRFHALDAPAFAHRLGLTAFCPEVAVQPLASALSCQPITALPVDASVRLFRVDGFKTHEVVIVSGKTLMVADLITNAPHVKGLSGLLMRMVGFTGPAPKLPKPVQKRVGRDLRAVAGLLNELAAVEGLARIIPTHGEIIETNAPTVLRAVSQTLG